MTTTFSKKEISSFLNIGIDAAIQASFILKEGFSKTHTLQYKEGRHNIVTECDKRSEELIIKTIKKAFPSHSFLAEESGLHLCSEETICWVIDPLDGTVNFAHQIPFFSVSIAATYKNNILCALVYSPMTNELFHAKKGEGAFLHDQRLNVSRTKDLQEGIFVTGFPYNSEKNPGHCIEHFVAFVKKGVPIRRLGSAALDLAYVAAGRFDGFWEISLEPWDFSAGALLIEEAGGIITSYQGASLSPLHASSTLAANPILHPSMQALIKEATTL